jgi:two-component system sensor histidine kinase DegS
MTNWAKSIEDILRNAMKVMDESRQKVFEITEGAHQELHMLNVELGQITEELQRTIDTVDHLQVEFRQSRVRLAEVSRDFKSYTEKDIKEAYEHANRLQAEILVYREKETHLKRHRHDLQKRIRNLERTIERAETVAAQMNVVLEYFTGDLSQVTRILETARNRQLIGLKIILAQEEERKRIAREIHDGPAQALANVALRAEIAERMVGAQPEHLIRSEIAEMKSQVRQSLEEVRKMIFKLRPMTIDDLGLIPALRKFTQDFEENYRITTRFKLVGQEVRLPSAMEVGVYRFVQEAFSNIHKHAEASFVTLEIVFMTDWLTVVVEDNGVGFRPDKLQKGTSMGEHFGLIGMKERTELLEGEFHLDSAPGKGTRVEMRVPIKNNPKNGGRS